MSEHSEICGCSDPAHEAYWMMPADMTPPPPEPQFYRLHFFMGQMYVRGPYETLDAARAEYIASASIVVQGWPADRPRPEGARS